MDLYFKFDALDDPRYLKKVGCWLITYCNPDCIVDTSELAITNLIPCQVDQKLEIRKITIQPSCTNFELWKILGINGYDGTNNQEKKIKIESDECHHLIQQLIADFNKYDVEITLLSK
jgi:hypothetical protein